MRLALLELRRRPGRFVAATVLLGLVALLLLFLGGLLDGLVLRQTAAIRAQRGDVIVYDATAEQSFVRSRVAPDLRALVAAAPGVTDVGGLGVVQLGARLPGKGPRDLADVALFGYERAPKGVPEPPPAGQGYADEILKDSGVTKGMTILLGPARTQVTVVGFVKNTVFEAQGSVWVEPGTWRAALGANRPDARVGEGVFQALVVSGSGGSAALAGAIDGATGGRTTTLPVAVAADGQPGVKQQKGTFNQIIGATIVIAIVVVALFFALLTVERTGLYGVLKAVGAGSRTLFAGIVAQAVITTAIASVVASAIALLVNATVPAGGVPFTLYPSRVASSIALLLLAAVIGCVFSLRRVLRVDPASAIGGGT
jgi:putative ABC transport system permease protein